MKIAAVQPALYDLLTIGLSEAGLLREMLVIDTDGGFEIVIYEAIVTGRLWISVAVNRRCSAESGGRILVISEHLQDRCSIGCVDFGGGYVGEVQKGLEALSIFCLSTAFGADIEGQSIVGGRVRNFHHGLDYGGHAIALIIRKGVPVEVGLENIFSLSIEQVHHEDDG